MDIDLQVGEVTQTLGIASRAALVNTESNLTGCVINQSPNAYVENPNFGRTISTSVSPRTVQLGLKFYW